MEQQATAVIGGLILVGIIWVAATTTKSAQKLGKLEVLLTGFDGSNGLNGDVKDLKKRVPDIERDVAVLKEWREEVA